jgi:hypothetical protein
MSVKIFISTVSDEFRNYRDQLRSDLTRHNVEVAVQGDFKDTGSVTVDKLDLYISTCDVVIHLVGDMTGADAKPASTAAIIAKYPDVAEKLPPLREPLDNGPGISYTQWEAWLALYHGKVLLIAKAEDAAPRGPNYNPTDVSRAAQKAHLQRLSDIERYPGITFASPDNLAKQIAYTTILDLLAKDRHVESPRDPQGFPYAAIVAALFLLLLTPLAADHLTKTIGLTLAAPIALLCAAGSLSLALLYWRYLGVLGAGAEPLGSLERQAYDALRASLATGGLPARLYARWLARFLGAVDHFFGDASAADRTLFPRAFGLDTPAPLWTAPAFDRCLLLALIYPIVTVFAIWGVSGHVGSAEEALGLAPDLSDWRRGLVIGLIGFVAFVVRQYTQTASWKSLIWLVTPAAVAIAAVGVVNIREMGTLVVIFIFLGTVTAASAAVVAGAGVVVAAVGVPSARAVDVATNVAGAIAVVLPVSFAFYLMVGESSATTGIFVIAFAAAILFVGSGAVAVTVSIAIAIALISPFDAIVTFPGLVAAAVVFAFAIALLNDVSMRNRRQGIFLSSVLAVMTFACLLSASFLSSSSDWQSAARFYCFLAC